MDRGVKGFDYCATESALFVFYERKEAAFHCHDSYLLFKETHRLDLKTVALLKKVSSLTYSFENMLFNSLLGLFKDKLLKHKKMLHVTNW